MVNPNSSLGIVAGRRPSIIHVAESFASGTASAIGDFVRNYPDAEHHLVYSFRDEARLNIDELTYFTTKTELPAGTVARIRFLRRLLRGAHGSCIVHAHSSMAGAYVRAAVRRTARRPLVYTPHCYSFERLDVSWPVRQAFRVLEWLLSFNTSAYAACSPREAQLSRWPLSSPRVVTVPNVQPPGLPRAAQRSTAPTLRIVGNGRLGPQKDPRFFAEAIRAAAQVHEGVEAVWVGGGGATDIDMLRAHGVEVTGWLPRAEALDVMAAGDLYLHTASWEGFPISIMEAAGIGLPVVARRRAYLHGVDLPVILDRPEDLAAAITDLRQAGALAALRRRTTTALAGNCDTEQRTALCALYGPLRGKH
ncbi:glycosyltransferase family 4 protein [Mycolicibacterium sp. CBMA 226]|uniref:glycosyltransferase family 4 protein n=1 Tax=Mycolicibacterium sp. CBMA 226 TaxID=2606611 RepID=UPI00130B729D|nr:glycosyltransferase family 4 protein [Mycolicibacterium sp. CBMA 226]MUL78129.1 glycosyltransferase family 4 protein [Mycolicibacterium sp. CBMA 226]